MFTQGRPKICTDILEHTNPTYRIMRSAFLCLAILTLVIMMVNSITSDDSDATGVTFASDGLCYEITSETPGHVKLTGPVDDSIQVLQVPSSVEYNEGIYTVTEIGDEAFKNCTSLTSVYIAENVYHIMVSAFEGCTELQTVTYADNVPLNSIRDSAFKGCSKLTSVVVPDSVRNMGESAFRGCSSITYLEIPASLNSVVSNSNPAFYGCVNIAEVKLTIGDRSVAQYTNEADPATNNHYRKTPFFYSQNSLVKLTVSEGITEIGNSTFRECVKLSDVTLSNNISRIGGYAFDGCTSLTSITFPQELVTIGNDSFARCSKLTSVVIPDNVRYIEAAAFRACTGITQLQLPIDVNTVHINMYPAFGRCTGITKVIFTPGTTGIGFDYDTDYGNNKAKYHALTPWYMSGSNFTTVEFHENITYIGDYTFSGCASLREVVLPDNMTGLGKCAFEGCVGLNNLTIPVSLNAVGDNSNPAFKRCENIENLRLTLGGGDWYPYSTGTDISMPSYTNTPWQISKKNIMTVILDEGLTAIPDRTYENCSALTSISLPNSLTSIGRNASKECASLASVAIPNNVTSIGQSAFSGCTGLSELSIPIALNSVSSNTYPAFSGCKSISRITFTTLVGDDWYEYDQSDTAHGDSYFIYTPWYLSKGAMTEAVWANGITTVPDSILEGCASLKSIGLPDTVTDVGSKAFKGCASLSSVSFPEGLTSIGAEAFDGCSITAIELPDSVTSVGENAFASDKTQTVRTGNGPTSLDGFRFGESLKTISLGSSISSISERKFFGCAQLTSIHVPAGVTSVGEKAFGNCTSLVEITVDPSNPAYTSVDGVLYTKDLTVLVHYPEAKVTDSYRMPDSVTTFDTETFKNSVFNEIYIGKNISSGFTVRFVNGVVTISDDDSKLLNGSSHRMAIEKNKDIPNDVNTASRAFDVFHVILEGCPELKDGMEVTITVDSQSVQRSVYQIYEDGNYNRLDSTRESGESGMTYTFKVYQSAYVSVMSVSEGIPYEMEIGASLLIIGTLGGLIYALIMKRKRRVQQ